MRIPASHNITMAATRVCLSTALTLLVLAVCFCGAPATEEKENEKLIEDACKHTDNYTLCVSLLESDNHTEFKSNIPGIIQILMNYTYTEASNNRANALKYRDATKGIELGKCLNLCGGVYSTSLVFLTFSIPYLTTTKDYHRFRSYMLTVRDAGQRCQASGATLKACQSIVEHGNQEFDQLCRILLAITNLLFTWFDYGWFISITVATATLQYSSIHVCLPWKIIFKLEKFFSFDFFSFLFLWDFLFFFFLFFFIQFKAT